MQYLIILLLTLLTTSLHAATIYTGKVIAITDGDTIKILTSDKQQIKVRLAKYRHSREEAAIREEG